MPQPTLDDLQRCSLLGDEQHAAALRQRIGDDVGDGLRLARAGRAMRMSSPLRAAAATA